MTLRAWLAVFVVLAAAAALIQSYWHDLARTKEEARQAAELAAWNKAKEAAAEIQRRGGWVSLTRNQFNEPRTTATLHEPVGPVNEKDLILLLHLRGLWRLHVHQPVWKEGSLSILNDCDCLNFLALGPTTMDAHLANVGTLTWLYYLDLTDSQITDNGLLHISQLKSLNHLNLEGTRITDKGLGHLKSLTTLEYLYIRRTGVNEAAILDLRDSIPELTIVRD